MSALPDSDFQFIAREVRARSGLVLTADKAYLLETRLGPLARKEGFASLGEFAAAARLRRDDRVLWAITDALTTNETYFFRDKAPFDLLRDRVAADIGQAARARGGRARIWCAACATGQEPYSVAMVLQELRALGRGIDADIVATDISERVLEKARAGLFSQFEVQRGLPVQFLVRYFEKTGDLWRVNDRTRAMVRFQSHNLIRDLRPLGAFDAIFCRNVLIYFDAQQKRTTLEAIAAALTPEGVLFLGAAETTEGVTDAFVPSPDSPGLFRRNAAWRNAA
jgi:chemotaxis protein methyltransferase CheR